MIDEAGAGNVLKVLSDAPVLDPTTKFLHPTDRKSGTAPSVEKFFDKDTTGRVEKKALHLQ